MQVVNSRGWLTSEALKAGLVEFTEPIRGFSMTMHFQKQPIRDHYVIVYWTAISDNKILYERIEKRYTTLEKAQNYFSRLCRQHHVKRKRYEQDKA